MEGTGERCVPHTSNENAANQVVFLVGGVVFVAAPERYSLRA